jgi:site-specific recombinase XerD
MVLNTSIPLTVMGPIFPSCITNSPTHLATLSPSATRSHSEIPHSVLRISDSSCPYQKQEFGAHRFLRHLTRSWSELFQPNKQQESVPPLASLPRVRRVDLHPEIVPFITDQNVQTAVAKMVGFVALIRRLPVREIRLADILTTEVEEALLHYDKHRQGLVTYARRFCRAAGNETMFKDRRRQYSDYHPMLLKWLDDEGFTEKRRITLRADGMAFLTWVVQRSIPGCLPHTVPLVRIQRAHLIGYRQFLLTEVRRGKMSRTTAKARLQHVVRWFRWLMDTGYIGQIDINRVAIRKSPNRERQLPTNLALSKFFSSLMSSDSDGRYTVFFLLLMATGARPIELRQLRIRDIDTEHQAIFLQSKGGFGRLLPLPPNVWCCLQNYLETRTTSWQPDDLVFGSPKTGLKLDHTNFVRKLADIQHKAGVHIDGLMAFRHRLATDCMEAKVPTAVFQYIFGHKGVSEMHRYQHTSKAFLLQEIRRAFQNVPWMDEIDDRR